MSGCSILIVMILLVFVSFVLWICVIEVVVMGLENFEKILLGVMLSFVLIVVLVLVMENGGK